ncbi:PEPxxWA-CTERM sorting domain-containing protein [Glacieibacterium sp.]|uniref:PEPxxWA-CTERM sorting domain-containing protein n=1 Tax=Glacieibacterium sp. TaxID=2860237 RepID=UPI003B0006EF
MFPALKSGLVAIASSCFALIAVPAAAATPIHITGAGIYAPGTVGVTTGTSGSNDYASLVKFNATVGDSTDSRDLIGFCIDLFHSIYVGVNTQLPMSLDYHVGKLTTDAHGKVLSSAQIQQITGLANLGFSISRSGAADKAVQLAAIQQAIWTVEYPGSSFVATGGYANQQALADSFVALAPTLTGSAKVMYADNFATQGFMVAGVPEPAVWAQLILGLGMVGAVSRRRARGVVTA